MQESSASLPWIETHIVLGLEKMDFKNFRMGAIALYCELQSPCHLKKVRRVLFRWISTTEEKLMKCIRGFRTMVQTKTGTKPKSLEE